MIVDRNGSFGLTINNENVKKVYKKKAPGLLFKYLLEYMKILSAELNIPMINYRFVIDEKGQWIISDCYDDEMFGCNVLLVPFHYDNISDGIYLMKDFTNNYKNSETVYNEFLKQIILSLLLNDADRTADNTKLYYKENELFIAPYLDIDLIMGMDTEEIFMDEYYLTKGEFDKLSQDKNTIYSQGYNYNCLVKDFRRCLENSMKIFEPLIFDNNATFEDILSIIYSETNDKQIFYKIISLDIDELIQKYGLSIPDNAYTIISTQFNLSKKRIQNFLFNLDHEVNKK